MFLTDNSAKWYSMATHNDLGKQGEEKAMELLLSKGHRLLERNYRFGRDEVDLITKHGKDIVFVEVKTRSGISFGHPEEFVDQKKRKAMKRVAEEYMYRNKLESAIRFDIVAILAVKDKMEWLHIEDAFFDEDTDAYQ